MNEIKLAEHRPRYYKNSEFMHAVDEAVETELKRLLGAADGMENEARADTAVDWLDVWENSVGLPNNTELTTEQRRSRVLARLRQIDTTTPERIKSIVQSYANGEVEITEDYKNYIVTIAFVSIIGKPDNMEGLIEQLSRIMPAHLAVEYIYKWRTWREVLETGMTWREILNAGYTWRDLLEKGVI